MRNLSFKHVNRFNTYVSWLFNLLISMVSQDKLQSVCVYVYSLWIYLLEVVYIYRHLNIYIDNIYILW